MGRFAWCFGFVWLIGVGNAHAHEQYPKECCNGNGASGDCYPVECGDIVETKTGYDYGKHHFEAFRARPSFNNRCHVCIYQGVLPLCVFIVPSS